MGLATRGETWEIQISLGFIMVFFVILNFLSFLSHFNIAPYSHTGNDTCLVQIGTLYIIPSKIYTLRDLNVINLQYFQS